MKRKRYDILIASTIGDLRIERKTIEEEILRSGHMPIRLERFSPSIVPPRELVEDAIADADIVVLIVGSDYGLAIPQEEGMSFTEYEYRYATKLGKPILAFIMSEEQLQIEAKNKDQTEKLEQIVRFRHAVTECCTACQKRTAIRFCKLAGCIVVNYF